MLQVSRLTRTDPSMSTDIGAAAPTVVIGASAPIQLDQLASVHLHQVEDKKLL